MAAAHLWVARNNLPNVGDTHAGHSFTLTAKPCHGFAWLRWGDRRKVCYLLLMPPLCARYRTTDIYPTRFMANCLYTCHARAIAPFREVLCCDGNL